MSLITLAVPTAVAIATSPPFFWYPESALPPGGTFIRHPLTGSRYYYASRPASGDAATNWFRGALYHSDPSKPDGEALFGLLSRFDFQQVFIHPVTHRFYALIRWQLVAPDSQGKLKHTGGAYLAWSADGVEWQNMTPPDRLLQKGAQMTQALREDARIVQDPEYPKRLCVTMLGPYGFVLRAVDDENSKWKVVELREWQQRYPTTAPASEPANR